MSKPNIIKEYCRLAQEGSNRFILRLPHYGHSLSHILGLFKEAQEDFKAVIDPHGLDIAQIQVVQYGGERYKRTYGIEFSLNVAPP